MDIRKLQRTIVDALEDVKAQDIQVFNTEQLTSLFDRVIIASGTSNRQTRALAASVRDKVRAAGGEVKNPEGESSGEWVLVDCGDAVVHLMQPVIRAYYKLEDIWGGKPVSLKAKEAAAAAAKAPARKAAAKAAPAKKATATRKAASPGSQPSAAKVAPRKAVAKKGTATKVVVTAGGKSAAAKSAPAKKAALKTVAAKKPAPPKVAASKVAVKKVAAKKIASRKTSI